MKTKILLPAILALSVITTGCVNHKELNSGVIENNKRVEDAITSYKEAKEVGVILEREINTILKNSKYAKLEDITEINSNIDVLNGVKETLEREVENIKDYIEMENLVAKDAGREDRINIEDTVDSYVETHYFLDDKSSKVEQVFIVSLPNGYVSNFTITWVGGVVVDFKTSRVN